MADLLRLNIDGKWTIKITLLGGPSNGSHEFGDNDDIMKRIKPIKDRDLRVAMVLYHVTRKGQIPEASQSTFQPVVGEELADLNSAARKYQIISRKENTVDNRLEIVVQYDPSD